MGCAGSRFWQAPATVRVAEGHLGASPDRNSREAVGSAMRLQLPRRRLLGHGDGLFVYLVDGEHVRNEIDVDFVNGGNGAVLPELHPAR